MRTVEKGLIVPEMSCCQFSLGVNLAAEIVPTRTARQISASDFVTKFVEKGDPDISYRANTESTNRPSLEEWMKEPREIDEMVDSAAGDRGSNTLGI